MRFTSLIVDDEKLAREGIRQLLSRDPDAETIYEAKNGTQAVDVIRARQPDLVFLDVQMPQMDAFDVVHAIGVDLMPPTVFVTAYDEHAIRAFEINAIDYLLKPVTAQRFETALARAKAQLALRNGARGGIAAMLEMLAAPHRFLDRIAIRSRGRIFFVRVNEIDWIAAAQNYVELHCGSTTHLLHVKLSALEKVLDPETFMRVHRSTIVNVGRIAEMHSLSHGEYELVLKTGTRLQASRTYYGRVRTLTTNPF